MSFSTQLLDIGHSGRQALAGVLDLLARLWARELDQNELTQFAHSEMAMHWQALGGWLPHSTDEIDEKLIDELAVDYCQLLVGPQHQIPPVQSVWSLGSYGSELAQSMQQFVDAMPEFMPCCPIVDHFAVQLQYAASLFSVDRSSLDRNAIEKLDALTERFLQTHLQWPARFLEIVEQAAQTMFYQGLARVTRNTFGMIVSNSYDDFPKPSK